MTEKQNSRSLYQLDYIVAGGFGIGAVLCGIFHLWFFTGLCAMIGISIYLLRV